MVDTLMTCDLLDLTHDEDVVGLAVVTADSDLLPPLVHARSLDRCPAIVITNLPFWSSEHVALMRECGIEYRGPEPTP
jgi:hypothetical protein